MDIPKSFDISPIGYVHSTLKERSGAPRQGWEGAPNARLEIHHYEWWALVDSNHGPHPYQGCALTT